MELILKEDIPSLGKAGQLVKVREGYGRNYLLPSGKAVVANTKNIKELEHHKRVIALRQEKLKKEALTLKEKVDQVALTILKEVGEEGRLFGSVTTSEIAHLLKERGFVIDKKQIHIEEPIKSIGIYEVKVRLQSEVFSLLKVEVNGKE